MGRQFKPGQLQTGSLYNISSSYAVTASYALNGGSGGSGFPFSGSAVITGSLIVTAGITGSLQGTASNASTASYINPTFVSQSAAANGFGPGVTYVSSSNNPLNEIEVADYDSNVAVTFVNG